MVRRVTHGTRDQRASAPCRKPNGRQRKTRCPDLYLWRILAATLSYRVGRYGSCLYIHLYSPHSGRNK